MVRCEALVIPMILEAFGGISPHSLNFIRRLALRATGARAAVLRSADPAPFTL